MHPAFLFEELYFSKYVLEAFNRFWFFNRTTILLIYICKLYNLETNQQDVRKNIFQAIWKVLFIVMRT